MKLSHRLKKLLIAFLPLFFSIVCSAQTQTTLLSAAETKKPVLLIFSGSDWCAPCIRLEKTILSETAFQSFANDNLTIIKADFPQRKKMTDDQKKRNEALADEYNPKGLFPHVVLLNADHSVLATVAYSNQTPDEFISVIKSHIKPQQNSSTHE